MSAAPDLRLRQKQAPVGIAAGAEDAKYQTKYKELKRKVKDIEADNDKLHFKVLQAKLTIRRMKMERALLYERLATVPPSPSLQDRHPLPPMSVIQGTLPGGPSQQSHNHLRFPPAGVQSQNRDYPFHSTTNIDVEQQRMAGGAHIHPDSIRHHQHLQHPTHIRGGGGDPRINMPSGMDQRSASVDNQPPASSPGLPVHSPPSRMLSTHEGNNIARQPQHNIPPTSVPYESRSISSIPHDGHQVHTSPPVSSHYNAPIGSSHSRKRSHSYSSPRTTLPHQVEIYPPTGHIHATQPYRVLSSGSTNNNSALGPGSGTVTSPPSLGQPPLHQYPEHLSQMQRPLHSPPLSEIDFERSGRAHPSYPHLHQQLPHQHPHSSGGAPPPPPPLPQSLPHHHHVVHHHHQQNHPPPAQAHTQNEYGGPFPVGDSPASPAIQAHGTGYESAGGRGTTSAGPPGAASANGAANPAGPASGTGRTHAHRMAYEYLPATQSEGKRDRDRDGPREREKDRDPDREWERERERAREYSRGELINYPPPHHRTRSSQAHPQPRPLSRAQSQSHASGGRPPSQTPLAHMNPNTGGEYEHSASSSSRSSAPTSGIPAPQAQYHPSPEETQGYRDYPPPPDSNAMYPPRLAPPSRAATPGVPSNAGSGSAIGHASVVGPDASNNLGPRDRDRDREGAQKDRGRQQQQQVTGLPSSAAAAGGAGDDDGSDHIRQAQSALDSGKKRSRNEMEMEVDGEYQGSNEVEARRNDAGGGREDNSRGAKRYHRKADSSPENERR